MLSESSNANPSDQPCFKTVLVITVIVLLKYFAYSTSRIAPTPDRATAQTLKHCLLSADAQFHPGLTSFVADV
jgi:hypothetical protein